MFVADSIFAITLGLCRKISARNLKSFHTQFLRRMVRGDMATLSSKKEIANVKENQLVCKNILNKKIQWRYVFSLSCDLARPRN